MPFVQLRSLQRGGKLRMRRLLGGQRKPKALVAVCPPDSKTKSTINEPTQDHSPNAHVITDTITESRCEQPTTQPSEETERDSAASSMSSIPCGFVGEEERSSPVLENLQVVNVHLAKHRTLRNDDVGFQAFEEVEAKYFQSLQTLLVAEIRMFWTTMPLNKEENPHIPSWQEAYSDFCKAHAMVTTLVTTAVMMLSESRDLAQDISEPESLPAICNENLDGCNGDVSELDSENSSVVVEEESIETNKNASTDEADVPTREITSVVDAASKVQETAKNASTDGADVPEVEVAPIVGSASVPVNVLEQFATAKEDRTNPLYKRAQKKRADFKKYLKSRKNTNSKAKVMATAQDDDIADKVEDIPQVKATEQDKVEETPQVRAIEQSYHNVEEASTPNTTYPTGTRGNNEVHDDFQEVHEEETENHKMHGAIVSPVEAAHVPVEPKDQHTNNLINDELTEHINEEEDISYTKEEECKTYTNEEEITVDYEEHNKSIFGDDSSAVSKQTKVFCNAGDSMQFSFSVDREFRDSMYDFVERTKARITRAYEETTTTRLYEETEASMLRIFLSCSTGFLQARDFCSRND